MKKDDFYAKIAFYVSLGFWIPLFNLGMGIVAIVFAVMAIRNRAMDPEKYGGATYAIIALVLGVVAIVGMLFWVFSGMICNSALCGISIQ